MEVGDAQPVPAEIPAETSDLSLTLIAGDERPWFAGDDGLYSPDGARHAVEADLSRREFLVPLGYDPGRDTLEVHALCYASGGRFVAVRGQIRVPTPVLFKGTDDNPPRLDDIDTWQTPREGIDIGDPKRIVRGGFEGVLDRESGEVTPYRLWPIHEFPLEVITNLVGNLGLGQDKKTRLFVKYTRSMFIHDRPVPQERLVLAVSGDGEYVASVDLATKRLELLRHGPREYGVVLSMENSIPGAKAKANENPCAAFAGRDGRTFLAQQGRELAIWKLDPKPRLLHRQLALPVDWLVVSRDGAEALGVPRGPGWWVDSRLSEGWWKDETDLFIAGLDGDRPQVSDLGTRLGIDVLRPTHMAFESDAATIRVLYVDYDGRLMRQDLPRP
ncbi:MAG: hypothetical protein HY719_16850 [Planctomycetes bacterium]|nr:hypothetical protein [Planctomycetota bacterium]